MVEGKWYEPETDDGGDGGYDPSEREPGAATGVHKDDFGRVDRVTYPNGSHAAITYSGNDKNAQIDKVILFNDRAATSIPNSNNSIRVLDDGTLVYVDENNTLLVLTPQGTTYGATENSNGTSTHWLSNGDKEVVGADGTASVSYDSDGKVTEANMGGTTWKLENGQYVESDSAGKPTGRTATQAPEFDKDGNLVVKTSDGQTETHTKEGATVVTKDGKVTQVYYNDGSSRMFGYDDKGNVNSVTERDGHVWTKDENGQWKSDDGHTSDAQVVVLPNGNMMVTSADGKTWEVRTADAPMPTKVLDK